MAWEEYLSQEYTPPVDPNPSVEEPPTPTRPTGGKFGDLKKEVQNLKRTETQEETQEKPPRYRLALTGGAAAALAAGLLAFGVWKTGGPIAIDNTPTDPLLNAQAPTPGESPQDALATLPPGDSPSEQAQAVLESSETYSQKIAEAQALSTKNLEVAQSHESLLARMLSFQLRVTQGRADPTVREALSQTRTTLTGTLLPHHSRLTTFQTQLPPALTTLRTSLADLDTQTQKEKDLEKEIEQLQKQDPSSLQLPTLQKELQLAKTQVQDIQKTLEETAQKIHREAVTLLRSTTPALPNLTVQTTLRDGSLRTDTIREGTIQTSTEKPKNGTEFQPPLLTKTPKNPETDQRVGIPQTPSVGIPQTPFNPPTQPAIPSGNPNILPPNILPPNTLTPNQGTTTPTADQRVGIPPMGHPPVDPSSPQTLNPPKENPDIKTSPTQTQDLIWQWQ